MSVDEDGRAAWVVGHDDEGHRMGVWDENVDGLTAVAPCWTCQVDIVRLTQRGVEALAAWEKSHAIHLVHREAFDTLRAGGFQVQLVDETSADVPCQRCRHRYGLHDDRGCHQVMRDDDDCLCHGFLWVDPAGPRPGPASS